MTGATPKKTATPKAKKPASAKVAEHPTYGSMIKKAIKELNEKGGSSKTAIMKYISANYKVNDKATNQVKLALRRMVTKKEIVHASSKSHGASGSFKLPVKAPAASKKPKSPKKKSPVKKAAAVPKATTPASPKKAQSPAKPKTKKAPAKKAAKKSPKKAAPKKK